MSQLTSHQKLKVFVTGLCLQGNKGGPALALSLKKQVKKYIPDVSFTFSVPNIDFHREMKWALKYHVDVIPDFGWKDLLPPFIFRSIRRIIAWLQKLRQADVIVDLSGVAYVGSPIGRTIDAVLGNRFRNYLIARMFSKKFLSWTQSYGPFSPAIVRFLARTDLKDQPIVFCRGDDCAAGVKQLLPWKKICSFPDVAVVLNRDSAWTKDRILSMYNIPDIKKLVTISPSAVNYTKGLISGTKSAHLKLLIQLCNYLNSKNYFILIAPHTFRHSNHDIRICDYAVGRELFKHIKNKDRKAIINDDLSAMELKSIISMAYFHVGARYHSLVAALSSGTPCIAISWHPKYKDLMHAYGCGHYVFESLNGTDSHLLLEMIDNIEKHRDGHRQDLMKRQSGIEELVEENTRLFVHEMTQ